MIEFFEIYFFTVPLQIILNLLFVIAGIIYYKRLNSLAVILFYSMASLMQSSLGVYFNVYEKNNSNIVSILESSINVFMIIEFLTFNYFILKSLENRNFKKIIAWLVFIFISIASFSWVNNHSFIKAPAYLTVIEAFFVIIGCLLYYYEKLNLTSPNKLAKDPAFFVINGMLILSVFLSPVSIYLNEIFLSFSLIYNIIYLINCLAYTVLFTFFILALRCQINIA